MPHSSSVRIETLVEQFDYKFHKAIQPVFDAVPENHRHCLMGVDYIHIKGLQGGDLFVTRSGWRCIESILPEAWFVGQKFAKVGRALAGATGAVYRVPVPHRARRNAALVVKFSRAAQDVGIAVVSDGLELDPVEKGCLEGAEFHSPFAEFSALHRLRTSSGQTLRTTQALAIYSPPTLHHDWELGRKSFLTQRMDRELDRSQSDVPSERKITYDWQRIYILLYRWMNGVDAEQAALLGLISSDSMKALAQTARAALREDGWVVCDHKPRHVIVRPRPDGGVLRRNGKIAWGLIDYELLVPVGTRS